jgi:putative acetyltransferase
MEYNMSNSVISSGPLPLTLQTADDEIRRSPTQLLSNIRSYEPKDATLLGAVFFDAVRRAGVRDYSQAQVEAWALAIPDRAWFEARAKDGRLILVAVNEVDEPIAYGDLEPNGHIDHLYCQPELIGSGVASALYDRLEQQARERGITKVFVEASEAARRLFLRKGFAEVKRRDFLLRGVKIHNYLMKKLLFTPA